MDNSAQLAGKTVKVAIPGGEGATTVADLHKVLAASARGP